ncbi:hypothetical protein BsWGS_14382 [Bradybaena similaris]
MFATFVVVSQNDNITAVIKKPYSIYYDRSIGDQDKSWTPHICCNTCTTNVKNWFSGNRHAMPFAAPMIWRDSTDHISNYYILYGPSNLERHVKEGNYESEISSENDEHPALVDTSQILSALTN